MNLNKPDYAGKSASELIEIFEAQIAAKKRTTVRVKTSELKRAPLNWAVAKARGFLEPMYDEPRPRVVVHTDKFGTFVWFNPQDYGRYGPEDFAPSTDWQLAGPIIEEERISPTYSQMNKDWQAAYHEGPQSYIHAGPTPLIAAMRCYVASKLGDEVDVPVELIEETA